jgi:epoxyqueuosine reductase QueG
MMYSDNPDVNTEWIQNIVTDFIQTSPLNTLKNRQNDKAFETPLVGFARGDDPLFEAFKDHVGPFHLTPQEIYSIALNDFTIRPEELAVICWILPHNVATKMDNRRENYFPAERWARGRIFGEQTNEALRKHVVDSLTAYGCWAVAPVFMPQFSIRISPKYCYASTWSERHAAYAAGLGTFGLCDGLITPVGKAMRVGTVVAKIPITPTERPYTDHRQYCLFFSKGVCGKCIQRCPAGAITASGKNKPLCRNYLYTKTKDYVTNNYGFQGYGCGLCQTGVPCESKIPGLPDCVDTP